MTTTDNVVSRPSQKAGVSSLNHPADVAFVPISQWALAIESDLSRIREWYLSVHIRELGGMTAHELAMRGSADLVIDFLRSIRRGERD